MLFAWSKEADLAHALCWDYLGSEKGKETLFEILPFDLSKGTLHG